MQLLASNSAFHWFFKNKKKQTKNIDLFFFFCTLSPKCVIAVINAQKYSAVKLCFII